MSSQDSSSSSSSSSNADRESVRDWQQKEEEERARLNSRSHDPPSQLLRSSLLSQSRAPSSSSSSSCSRHSDLWKPSDQYAYVPTAAGEYVTKIVGTKGEEQVSIGANSLLPRHPPTSGRGPILVYGGEKDITDKLANDRSSNNDSRRNITMEVGLKWPNGEAGRTILLADCIVEWRDNLGKPSKNKNSGPEGSIYGISYLSLGIPYERYMWFVKQALAAGLHVDMSEKDQIVTDPNDSRNKWTFVNAGITSKRPPGLIVDDDDNGEIGLDKVNTLYEALATTSSHLLGTVGIEMTVKRNHTAPGRHLFGFSIKFMQVADETKIGTPGLNIATVARGIGTKINPKLRDKLYRGVSGLRAYLVSSGGRRNAPPTGDMQNTAVTTGSSSSSSSSSSPHPHTAAASATPHRNRDNFDYGDDDGQNHSGNRGNNNNNNNNSNSNNGDA